MLLNSVHPLFLHHLIILFIVLIGYKKDLKKIVTSSNFELKSKGITKEI